MGDSLILWMSIILKKKISSPSSEQTQGNKKTLETNNRKNYEHQGNIRVFNSSSFQDQQTALLSPFSQRPLRSRRDRRLGDCGGGRVGRRAEGGEKERPTVKSLNVVGIPLPLHYPEKSSQISFKGHNIQFSRTRFAAIIGSVWPCSTGQWNKACFRSGDARSRVVSVTRTLYGRILCFVFPNRESHLITSDAHAAKVTRCSLPAGFDHIYRWR